MRLIVATLLVLFIPPLFGANPATVNMFQHAAGTYYVDVSIASIPMTRYLVDTGASHATIEKRNIRMLLDRGEAEFIKNMSGLLANGQRVTLPVYRVRSVRIANQCEFKDVEIVAVEDGTRCVLGLSVLRKAAPLTMSMEPPRLLLNQCAQE